jgi:two-component system, sensor histidine kinase
MSGWFGTGDYVPHGFCLAWDPDLMAVVVLSNGLIALAYPCVTIMLVLKATEPVPVMPRWIFWAYAAFILCCGVSHLLDDVTLWIPLYRLQSVVLAVTALVSLLAAVVPVSLWLTHAGGPRRH